MEEGTLDLRDLWKIIRRRKWIIISITIIFMILGLAVGFMSQRSLNATSSDELYKSSASILITNFPDEKSQSVKGQVELNQQLTKAYGAIAESRTVAEKTIKRMNLNVNTDDFMHNINVVTTADAQVITIHYSEDKNDNQQKVLNAYVKNFMEEANKIYPQGKLKVLDEPSKTERISKDDFTKLTTPVQQDGKQQTATTQTTKKTKSKKLILAVSILLGLMVGFGTAFVVEYMDNTLKKKEEAEELLNQTAVGIIPYSNSRNGEEYEEAFRSLRTSLQYKDGNVFMVTSPSCKDGKTSVCIGLAKSFVDSGYKTLIIDANGRNPQVKAELNLDEENGLSNILKNSEENFENLNLLQTKIENMYVLCWGSEDINPSDLLTRSSLKVLLEELKKKFDYVIIDTPVMIKYSDAQIIAKAVDNILVLMTEGNTNVSEAKRFKGIIELSQIKANGLIWREGKF